MTQMITDDFLDSILAFLAPIFRLGGKRSDTEARQVANLALNAYQSRDDHELQIAALAIAYSFGALEQLGRSMDKALSPNQTLRLRSNAVSLGRSANQAETRFSKLHNPATREKPAPLRPRDAIVPPSPAPEDLLAFAKTTLQSIIDRPAAPEPQLSAAEPLSRQQRRDQERQAEKARRSAAKAAERAQRAAALQARRAITAPA